LPSTGNVNVNNSATLGGVGTVGNVTLDNGSSQARTNPGATIGAVGTLSMRTLHVTGGQLRFDVAGLGNNDHVSVANGATFDNNSVLALISTAAITAGTYTVLNAGTLTLNTLPKVASTYRQSVSLSTTATTLSIVVGGVTSAT